MRTFFRWIGIWIVLLLSVYGKDLAEGDIIPLDLQVEISQASFIAIVHCDDKKNRITKIDVLKTPVEIDMGEMKKELASGLLGPALKRNDHYLKRNDHSKVLVLMSGDVFDSTMSNFWIRDEKVRSPTTDEDVPIERLLKLIQKKAARPKAPEDPAIAPEKGEREQAAPSDGDKPSN